MNRNEALFCRRTVRKFKMEPLRAEFLKRLKNTISSLTPYIKGLKVDFLIVDNSKGEVSTPGIFQIRAPYYLLLSTEAGDGAAINAGYLMQQIVIYLTEHGLGTCYQGNFRPTESMSEKLKYNYCIAIAFGNADTMLMRETSEAVRLDFAEIVTEREELNIVTKSILEAGRIAPSYFNSQPWRFAAYNNRIHVFSVKKTGKIYPTEKNTSDRKIQGLKPADKVKDVKSISIGAALANIVMAAEVYGLKADLLKLENIAAKRFKDNDYIVTIIVK